MTQFKRRALALLVARNTAKNPEFKLLWNQKLLELYLKEYEIEKRNKESRKHCTFSLHSGMYLQYGARSVILRWLQKNFVRDTRVDHTDGRREISDIEEN
mgnify:CR=1 FL=1